jgi:hypothetical protein
MEENNNMMNEYYKKQTELEKILKETTLTPEQKKIITTAVKFGYSAAFCQRTSDMNGSYFSADRYREGYENIVKMLEK